MNSEFGTACHISLAKLITKLEVEALHHRRRDFVNTQSISETYRILTGYFGGGGTVVIDTAIKSLISSVG
jgi:hypothetical protein